MTTTPDTHLVDLDELEALAKACPDDSAQGYCCSCGYTIGTCICGPRYQLRYATKKHAVLALIAETRALRAKAQGGGWKPFFFGESTPIREGQSYLFAAGSATTGWSYFHDALVWDAETYAQWRDGDHGFATEDVKFYWELPAPPEASNG